MKKIKAALLGAGQRGLESYGYYALRHPHEIQFIAVAEPDDTRRASFAAQHHIAPEFSFRTWEDLLNRPQLCEAIVISTQDKMHFRPAELAMRLGYEVLLEKPMSPDPWECIQLARISEELGRTLMISHVLRYTPFFSTIKSLLIQGRIGRVMAIQHNENIGYWHYAHSYVRGNWRNSRMSSPMILAKGCHDLDILLFLLGEDCIRLSSFGSLSYFRCENAPAGSTERCIDGCRVENSCPYSALKIYLETSDDGWPVSVIAKGSGIEERLRALREGDYGRCVFRCDNDAVDHQVVNMEFADGATVAFTMCAFTSEISRTIKVMGTSGEIRGQMKAGEIATTDFSSGHIEVIGGLNTTGGHSGGDDGLMRAFLGQLREGKDEEPLTSARLSVQSHLMAFAAEDARINGQVIDLREYLTRMAGIRHNDLL